MFSIRYTPVLFVIYSLIATHHRNITSDVIYLDILLFLLGKLWKNFISSNIITQNIQRIAIFLLEYHC